MRPVTPPSFSSELATGVTFGSYVVGELIGRGAMASVYRAEHVMLNKAVALKLMDRSLLDSPGARERFLREGRVVASIAHPNVVDITDLGVHEGTPYLVMELLVGEDLHKYLVRHAPLDDRTTTRLALPLIAALSAAHDAGVVHRDVKPSNIFLEHQHGGELIPKVLDFGISKFAFERTELDLIVTSPNQLIGSPMYLAPEALRGPAQIGPAADQYSLGVVLYECVTGRPPFHGDTLMALLGALSRGVFEPPSAIRPDISPALERIIGRALALDPRDRFPSLRDMGAALLELAAERTQVVWASSFKSPPALEGAEAPLPLSSRSPNGPLALSVVPDTLPVQSRLGKLKGGWIAAAALAAVVALALLAAGFGAWTRGEAPAPASAAIVALQTAPAASSPAAAPVPIQHAPAVAAVPGRLQLDDGESADVARARAEPGSSKGAVGSRARALQPSRHATASAVHERKARSPRGAATAPETSETAVSPSEEPGPAVNTATRVSPAITPASADRTPRRQGANQSPLLD